MTTIEKLMQKLKELKEQNPKHGYYSLRIFSDGSSVIEYTDESGEDKLYSAFHSLEETTNFLK